MLLTSRLQTDKGHAAIVVHEKGSSPFVLVCEHAGLALPDALGDLGLSAAELKSHIAWDPGAPAVAEMMAAELDAVLIKQRYSRLVYDCNRPPSSNEAMRVVSEQTQIPGNVDLSLEEKQWRIRNIYEDFHDCVAQHLDQRNDPVLVTVHSFTPVYHGVRRLVDVGILHDEDARLADGVLSAAKFDEGILVRRNEPYGPQDGVTHTLKLHSEKRRILNVMIEIKSDLIENEKDQQHYAQQLVDAIKNAVGVIDMTDNKQD